MNIAARPSGTTLPLPGSPVAFNRSNSDDVSCGVGVRRYSGDGLPPAAPVFSSPAVEREATRRSRRSPEAEASGRPLCGPSRGGVASHGGGKAPAGGEAPSRRPPYAYRAAGTRRGRRCSRFARIVRRGRARPLYRARGAPARRPRPRRRRRAAPAGPGFSGRAGIPTGAPAAGRTRRSTRFRPRCCESVRRPRPRVYFMNSPACGLPRGYVNIRFEAMRLKLFADRLFLAKISIGAS